MTTGKQLAAAQVTGHVTPTSTSEFKVKSTPFRASRVLSSNSVLIECRLCKPPCALLLRDMFGSQYSDSLPIEPVEWCPFPVQYRCNRLARVEPAILIPRIGIIPHSAGVQCTAGRVGWHTLK